MTARRKTFLTQSLPAIFREMILLGITIEEIEKEWEKAQQ